jgi:hypothetical protein
MNSRYIFTLLALALMFLLPVKALAEYTYEEPGGKFAIDLSEGWALAPQGNENVFVFKTREGRIIIGYLPGVVQTDELFSKALGVMKATMAQATSGGFIKDMTISGHPARWGVYSGLVEHGGAMVKLYALLGAVSLDEGGIYFQSYLNEGAMKAVGQSVERAFRSIRNVGQGVTAPENIQGTFSEPAPSNTPVAREKVFYHERVVLTLPPDWEEQPLPEDASKESVGIFRSLSMGGSLAASCHRGLLMSRDRAMKAAREDAEEAVPGASPVQVRRVEISGQEVPVTLFRGTVQGVPTAAVTLTVKTGRCWLNLVGTAPARNGEDLEVELMEIAASAR